MTYPGLVRQFENCNCLSTFLIPRALSPGRFWAASEMKAMMAHLIINYDIGPGPDWVSPNASPPPQNFGVSLVPDPTKHIMIRRRKK